MIKRNAESLGDVYNCCNCNIIVGTKGKQKNF